MATAPRTFSMNHLAVALSSLSITGYADGEGLTISFGDDFIIEVGTNGEVIAIQQNVKPAEMTLKLAQGNPLISQIRQLHAASVAAGGTWLDFSAKNLKSPDQEVAGRAMIMGQPPMNWATSVQPEEIKMQLAVSKCAGGALTAQ